MSRLNLNYYLEYGENYLRSLRIKDLKAIFYALEIIPDRRLRKEDLIRWCLSNPLTVLLAFYQIERRNQSYILS